jgi:anti-sigma factor RsiW
MARSWTDTELEAYLDEALPADLTALVESAIRGDMELQRRLRDLIARRDAGLYSLGGIWRRHRITCLSRERLGSYLLGVLPDAEARYAAVHLAKVGCPYCQANLADLQAQQETSSADTARRRQRYIESSAGRLKK